MIARKKREKKNAFTASVTSVDAFYIERNTLFGEWRALASGLFFAGVVVMPAWPFLMTKVKFNVAINEGKPPPGWKEMVRYRGW